MAFLLPENIPTRNDISSRLNMVGKLLKDIAPDKVTVWLKRDDREEAHLRDDREEAHLLVLDPSSGILVVEAPSRLPRKRRWGRQPQAPGVRESVRRRMSEIQGRAVPAGLDDLPVACALALPDLRLPEAESYGWRTANTPLLTQEDFQPDRLRVAFKRILGSRPDCTLTEQQVQKARSAVNPSIIIGKTGKQGRLAFRPPELSSEEILRVLDRRQERVAEHLGWGYRMIRGVAGSGKTLVLIHRARHLARRFPQWRILVLCFNKALSLELQRQIGSNGRVEVRTVDALAYEHTDPLLRKIRGDAGFRQRRESAIEMVQSLNDNERFDAVLVDEAQDLGKSGMDLAWAMLKPHPRNMGNFIMALDPDQDIFLRKKREMDWNPPGMTAQGRTTLFRRNYRNTRGILELAWGLLSEVSPSRRDIIEPEVAREGRQPSVLECGDLMDEARMIASRVKGLLVRGVKPDSILVMFGPSKGKIAELCEAFERSGTPYYFVPRRVEDVIRSVGKVRVSTLRLLKGLEFSRVLIGGANHVSMPNGQDDPEAIGRLLYVGMTRAIDDLTVTYSGAGPMGAALRRARTSRP